MGALVTIRYHNKDSLEFLYNKIENFAVCCWDAINDWKPFTDLCCSLGFQLCFFDAVSPKVIGSLWLRADLLYQLS